MTSFKPFGVIFDMDGVLIDSSRPHLQSWQALAGENGVTVTPEQFASTFGQQNRDIIPALFGSVSDARMVALADRKEELYRDLVRGAPPIVDGAVSLVQDLHEAGAALAVGSSGPRANIDLVLTAMGVQDHITVIVSADDVTRGKPDPQVFSLAAQGLGIEPNRCAVIEDAPVGITAAKAAGTKSVAVLMHHPAAAFAEPDLIVAELANLSVEALASLTRP